ncbi:MAG: choice-of-anchor Q domain-containing protein [Bacteroidales bacterium]
MKAQFLLGIILALIGRYAAAQPCDIIFNPSPKNTLLIKASDFPSIGPGKTICLKAGKYFNIRFENLRGTESNPILIRPLEGDVIIDTTSPYGIKFSDCQFLKIDGLDEGQRKIRILKTNGTGVSIDDRSTDIEVAWLEIGNTGLAGIVAKSDPDCSFNTTRDSFLMKNITIRDNFLHDIGLEGMYIGSTYFFGRTIHCGNHDTTVLPHVNHNIHIYNNFIFKTGYDGMQVSSTVKSCFIHDNTIWYDSQLKQPGQMSGIIVGAGNALECYNNTIINGAGHGIEIHSQGGRIFNNVIVNNGRSYRPNTQGVYVKPGIFVGYNLYNPDNLPYRIYNNTIYRPKSEGVKFSNTNSPVNEFINNIIVDPGIWKYYDSLNIPVTRSFLNIDPGISYISLTNYFTQDTLAPQFANPESYNFMLQENSPLVDAGTHLGNQGVVFDRNNSPRPQGKGYDIGAFEYFAQQGLESPKAKESFRLFYDISRQTLLLMGDEFSAEITGVAVYNSMGQCNIKQKFNHQQGSKVSLDVKHLPAGIYVVNIETAEGTFGRLWIKGTR